MASRICSAPQLFCAGLQVRILALVFLFMAVLFLMGEARKPKNWQWMWRFSDSKVENESPATDSASLPKPSPSASLTDPAVMTSQANGHSPSNKATSTTTGAQDQGGRLPASRAENSRSATDDKPDASPSPETALEDGWHRAALRRLSKDHRQRLLLAVHQQQTDHLSPDDAEWKTLLARLQGDWQDYLERAEAFIVRDSRNMTADQRQQRLQVLEDVRSSWQRQQTVLAALAETMPLSAPDRKVLQRIQQTFDVYAWLQVEDNTVLRGEESMAWFWCWARLKSIDPQQLTDQSELVNYVQLFSQPAEFRGELVKLRGTARWAYRLKSQSTWLDTENYVVLGILPNDGSNAPLVVYCSDVPHRFPTIGPADSNGRGTVLDEDLEVAGFFFKRWLHRSQEGTTLSPLVLGKVITWQATADTAPASTPSHPPPSMIWSSVLAMMILAALIAGAVYRNSSKRLTTTSRKQPATLPTIDPSNIGGSVAERLRGLSSGDDDE